MLYLCSANTVAAASKAKMSLIVKQVRDIMTMLGKNWSFGEVRRILAKKYRKI